MARPRKKIDPEAVSLLATVGCTNEEIAAALGCSADTLTRRFAEAIERGRNKGRASLRRKQWQVAMKDGHKAQGTMLVWLGKQMLGQKERHDIGVKVPPGAEGTGDASVVFTMHLERPNAGGPDA